MKQLDHSDASTRSDSNLATFVDSISAASLLQLPPSQQRQQQAPPPLLRHTLPSSDIVLSFDDDERYGGAAMLDCQYQFQHPYRTQQGQLTPIIGANGDSGGVFHLQTYGALRKGGAVSLFSQQYYGYALSAACSGYMYVAIEFVLMRFPTSSLGVRPESVRGLRDLLHLQWAIVLLLGLLSDSYAPFGYRRNGYIVGGWVAVSLFWCVLFVLFQFSDAIFDSSLPPPNAAIACMTGAMFFLVVLTNATDIRIVELAQQEELYTRGKIVATYQALRIGAQVLLHSLVKISGISAQYVGFNNTDVELSVSPLGAKLFILHLGLLALIPIPFVAHCAYEAKLRCDAASTQFLETCRQFWRSAQQKAIWQLIAFNCVLYFFSFLEYKDVGSALSIWNQQSAGGKLTQSVVSDACFVLALLAWKSLGVNANWRKSTAFVVVSWTLVYCLGNSLVALSVVRHASWFAVLLGSLKAAFRVLLLFSAFIPTVEVAQIGSEGTIYGLLSSFQAVVKALGDQLSYAVVKDAPGLRINLRGIATSSSSPGANHRVFYWVLALTGIKLLALTALVFCPQQKLDAQQLRIYGGYSRVALLVFLVAYALSYPYATYLQLKRLSV